MPSPKMGDDMWGRLSALHSRYFVLSTLCDQPAHYAPSDDVPMFVKFLHPTRNACREDAQRRWIIVYPVELVIPDTRPVTIQINISRKRMIQTICLERSKLQKMLLKFSPDGEPTLHAGRHTYCLYIPDTTLTINIPA